MSKMIRALAADGKRHLTFAASGRRKLAALEAVRLRRAVGRSRYAEEAAVIG